MISAQHPLRLRAPSATFRHAEDKLEVEVLLVNEEERPLFVTIGIRQILYDAPSRTLNLWLTDHARSAEAPHGRCGTISVPRTQVIEAGARHPLHLDVPRRLTRLVPHEDKSFHFEDLDLSQAQQINVHVGCSEKPFYYNPKGPAVLEQLKAWCAVVEVSAHAAKPPKKEKPAGRKK
ncbi:hypothetical protein SAMN05660860_01199 [Geoalkalibacter ferrihydriticus]|uniref:Uncharacterized protein n=2 Tax=Geoalkalibacter ferrihydriticus TaxID=392333 RepID=A0A0C2EGH0_9BACT|nr:hypothetical protein [Geoalkalibacter ferrihydriticus]KIH77718.1 hypothetical protein GFER_03410 [Geoalkalibacter ferrihydriticus DSM 17813]SDL75498.1 hypothetical protein SAMN05660860_01199 [Geoalkalibacter ferrihydriticus]